MKRFNNTKIAFQSKSTKELRKADLLFRLVQNKFLTRLGAWFIKWGIYLPGMKTLVKNTIFEQFCGGETRDECLETIYNLSEYNIGSILDYSVEGKEEESEYDSCHKEIMAIIDLAMNNENIPFVVFKPTGFGNIDLYEKVSKAKVLTPSEKQQWENIRSRFYTVCEKAHNNGVTLMVDAEESWMQDSVDDLVEEMMQTFNKERCVVVNTLQMYRHDRLNYLKTEYQKATEGKYYIGFKIVRGAYMEKERDRAEEKGYPSPIQLDKAATDRDYNLALEFIIERIDKISLFAGTHNEYSCSLLADKIDAGNQPKNYHKLWFGQLYGMSDNISYNLADQGYNVAKYVPYGPVKEVLPYLIRRAEENTSVAGQTGRELALIERELKRRESLKTSSNE